MFLFSLQSPPSSVHSSIRLFHLVCGLFGGNVSSSCCGPKAVSALPCSNVMCRRSLLLFREELLLFPCTSDSGHRPQTVVFLFPGPRVGLVLARGCDPLLARSTLPVLVELVSPTGQLWSVAHLQQLFFRSLFSPHRPFLIKWMLALQDLRPLLIFFHSMKFPPACAGTIPRGGGHTPRNAVV